MKIIFFIILVLWAAFILFSSLFREKKNYNKRKQTSELSYKALYRFEEANVEWLAEHFIAENFETRGAAVTAKMKMQIFLRYVADPGFQSGVGEDLGVHQTTVCKIIQTVTKNILNKAHIWIKFPTTTEEIIEAKDQWSQKNKIPYVIGAIDCTHVRISKPHENGDEYINRKGFPSFNVQATCNSNEEFTSVSAEWPGSVHDSRIFKLSKIGMYMKNRAQGMALIGDSGYAVAPWLITPYSEPKSDVEKYFNKIYAKERVIIERCFGLLKARFPILHYKIRVSLKNISSLIICCFVLHNIAKYLKDANDFEDTVTHRNNEEPDGNGAEQSDARIRLLGNQMRDQVANIIFGNRG